MKSNETMELTSAFIDGNLTSETRRTLLDEIEQNDENREEFDSVIRLHGLLRSRRPAPSQTEAVMKKINSLHEARASARVLGETGDRRKRKSHRRLSLAPWLSVAASLAIITGALVYNYRQAERFPEVFVAQIRATSPGVKIIRVGNQIAAVLDMPLLAGDRIRTGRNQHVTLGYQEEETEIKVDENSVLDIGDAKDGKMLYLEAGEIDASVAPQPSGRPMVVTTPQASAEVKGTVFSLGVARGQTRLEVEEGLVRLTRLADNEIVDVAAGKYAVAAQGVVLAALELSDERTSMPLPRTVSATLRAPGDTLTGLIRVEREREDYRVPFEWPNDYVVRGVTFGEGALWMYWRWNQYRPEILWRIDPDSGAILDRVEVKTSLAPKTRIAWDKGLIWARTIIARELVAIDPATGEVTKKIELPRAISGGGAFDVTDGILWVAGSMKLLKIDLASGKVILTFDTRSTPSAMTVQGDIIYCRMGLNLEKRDTRDGRLLSSIPRATWRVEDLAVDGKGRIWSISFVQSQLIIVRDE